MTGNQALLGLVVHHGGKEGAFFPSAESVSAHLLSLITESRKQVQKFKYILLIFIFWYRNMWESASALIGHVLRIIGTVQIIFKHQSKKSKK